MRFFNLVSPLLKDCEGAVVSLLGGGGKTALLHKIANELSDSFPRVLQTSLTKTAFYKSENPMILDDIEAVGSVKRNPLFVIGDKIDENKLQGISVSQLNDLRKLFDATIFECDGAKNKPLKAHTDYDPKVPEFATNVIIIIGADVVDTKISDGLVHRPELFCELWNIKTELKLDIDFIVKVVSSKQGYLSKVTNDAKITYFVNKADAYLDNAKKLAQQIYESTGNSTFYGSIKNNLLVKVEK